MEKKAIDKHSFLNNSNPEYIEELYNDFLKDPSMVDTSWQQFFAGIEFANENDLSKNKSQTVISNKEISVSRLIEDYRTRGHLISNTNPIRKRRSHKSDLELDYFQLCEDDLETEFEAAKQIGLKKTSLKNILAHLKQTYCGSIGVEFTFCQNEKLRDWLIAEMESCSNQPTYTKEEKLEIAKNLSQAVIFENFLQTKYVGKKRFSLEGLEVLIPALERAIRFAANNGAKEFILGMAHRGRLNVLANIFQKPYDEVFTEFDENVIHDFIHTGGDVKYHLGKSADIVTPEGHNIHLSLVPNPSHLEAVGPVLEGIVHAKKKARYNNNSQSIVPIIIHGDAALSGQGVNYEVANMSKIEGYENGGSIHIVTNNQVGFTANYKESRSSMYCTDLAKVTESPIFHVNADDPEAVIHAIRLAIEIRYRFEQDVYVDILGYRKYGHNEGDEPRFTQPLLYEAISKHKNVFDVYINQLEKTHDISIEDSKLMQQAFKNTLQEKLEASRKNGIQKKPDMFQSSWKGYRLSDQKDMEESTPTKISKKSCDLIMKSLTSTPEDFNLFSKTKKIFDARKKLYYEQKIVDWSLAEQLAFGSLILEGYPVRVSGQDSQRGTFSHRHAVIKDTKTESHYIPLNNIPNQKAKIEVYNSLLSEYGVLAFEYGYSIANPNALVVWEAQFGDFANGAQIVIDQFISTSEIKWQKFSGLTCFLPHGYEGQGPEHSSARFERFLQLCAEDNMYVCNITTPANLFHVLRRQLKNEFRKPLIIMSPKSLLRHPLVQSPVTDLTSEKFKEIIDDEKANPKLIKKVMLCTGKIYYDLIAKKDPKQSDVAIVRLEQLYPFAKKQMNNLKRRYSKAKKWVWVQEEPENMGAWGFMLRHYRDWNLQVIARPGCASPSTGSSKIHTKTQNELIIEALKSN